MGGSTGLEHLVLRWGLSNLKDGGLIFLRDGGKQPRPEKRLTEGEDDPEWVAEERDDKYHYSREWVTATGLSLVLPQLIFILDIVTGSRLEESVTKWTSCGIQVDCRGTECIGAPHLGTDLCSPHGLFLPTPAALAAGFLWPQVHI